MMLTEKITAAERVYKRACWPEWMRTWARSRMQNGHRQYGDTYQGEPPHIEAITEQLDTGNYVAFDEMLTGASCWRMRLVAFLTGINGRLLAGVARRRET